jgi:hypothetical protein
MSSGFDFKIDVSDFRGIEHEEFRTNLLNLALTKPTDYNKLRMIVLRKVKKAAVDAQYGIYYYLLTEGCLASDDGKTKGLNILADATVGFPAYQEMFKPNVPKHIVNEFAMKASATIDKIAEEAINMIMPKDWKTIADERIYSKTKGTMGFDN